MKAARGYLAVVSAVVLCPCHLPLLAAIFAGTALGTVLAEHAGLLFPLMAGYFVVALAFGLKWMTSDKPSACPVPDAAAQRPAEAETGAHAARIAR
jgi:mercuric ion transport protein